MRNFICDGIWRVITCWTLVICVSPAMAKIITLKNGLEYQGQTTSISSLGDDVLTPSGVSGQVDVELIVVVDDGLRRTFVPKYEVTNIRDEVESLERIRLKQGVNRQGNRLGNVGSIVEITPFDPWGRRTFSMLSPQGRVNVIQGITDVTPVWTKVQGLKSNKPYVWDMRIATSSIPRDKLREIFQHHLDFSDPDVRLSIVRLYLQAERYGDAEDELRAAIADFPKLQDLDKQLTELRQLHSKQQLAELRLRRDAGQHNLVKSLLQAFPVKDVAGEILLEVSEIAEAYQREIDQAQQVVDRLAEQIATIQEEPRRASFEQFLAELRSELNSNSFARLGGLCAVAARSRTAGGAEAGTGHERLAAKWRWYGQHGGCRVFTASPSVGAGVPGRRRISIAEPRLCRRWPVWKAARPVTWPV